MTENAEDDRAEVEIDGGNDEYGDLPKQLAAEARVFDDLLANLAEREDCEADG